MIEMWDLSILGSLLGAVGCVAIGFFLGREFNVEEENRVSAMQNKLATTVAEVVNQFPGLAGDDRTLGEIKIEVAKAVKARADYRLLGESGMVEAVRRAALEVCRSGRRS